ncbi:MAG: YkgJ family cysteine cluster protein [Desulfamplus sp.]|nr:YkgJ family cysteine cluster protein [Desulfamplus sp.]
MQNTLRVIRKDGFAFEFNPEACSLCSAGCCRGDSGNVWVNPGEIQNICNLVGLNLIDGMNRFFEKRENRYSIRECVDDNYSFAENKFSAPFTENKRTWPDLATPNNENEIVHFNGKLSDVNQSPENKGFRCIFLDNAHKCSIYPARPLQCRTFPFWNHFKTDMKLLIQECPGLKML